MTSTRVVVDDVAIPVRAQHLALVVPECPGLVYSLHVTPTATRIVRIRYELGSMMPLRTLATYATTRDALVAFKDIVTRAERQRRADEAMERMAATLELAASIPLDDDDTADDGL